MRIQRSIRQYRIVGALLLVFFILSCAMTPEQSAKTKAATAEFTVDLPNLPQGAVPLRLVRISPGSFLMGSPESEAGREANEGPQHRVMISKDFYLGAYEITQAQWKALMGNNPSTDAGRDFPVNKVSWDDCQHFIRQLNSLKTGGCFRLPTEAEFEYAARAGTQTASYLGNDVSDEDWEKYAWFRNNSDGELHSVGQLKPNPLGLYDLFGNVWEWCQDWYGPYSPDPQIDPIGMDWGEEKVMRGSSWMGRPEYLRSADRGKFPPDSQRNTGGLRIAWSE
ncbi:MAG: formylglycine-generating enzyme family protein [Candidatus Omnitrophota bacterium]